MKFLVAATLLTLLTTTCDAGFVISLGGAELSSSGAGALAQNAVTLTFENLSAENGSNRVMLTLDAPNQTIPQWWWEKGKLFLFNSSAALSSITYEDGVEAENVTYPNTKNFLGTDFNVKFKFSNSGATGSFFPGKTSRYILSGGTDLDADTSFNVSRATNSGVVTLGGMHILETFDKDGNATGSGKYGSTSGDGSGGAVPEPASLAVWAAACCLGLLIRRRSGVTLAV